MLPLEMGKSVLITTILFLFCLIYSPQITGQTIGKYIGLPYINNFSYKEYNAHPQNYAIVQDNRGFIYIGNNDGILEYDGQSWSLIKTTNNSAVRSLDIDRKGRIYVGGQGEFGYLQADSIGFNKFIGLSNQLPKNQQQFGDVRQTFVTPDNGIYFLTVDRIFNYNNGEFTILKPKKTLIHQPGFYVNGKLYVNERGTGLKVLVDGNFQAIQGGEEFANEGINIMLSLSDNEILIGSRSRGLYVYNGYTISPFLTEIDAYFTDYQVTGGVLLPKGLIGIGTLRGGFVIINKEGELMSLINRSNGLQDNSVRDALSDPQEGIWLATSSGVSRVEAFSPLSYYNEQIGLRGNVNDIIRHNDQIYAATSQGLFYMSHPDLDALNDQSKEYHSSFTEYPNLTVECRGLVSAYGKLLVGTSVGLYQTDTAGLIPVYLGNVNCLYQIQGSNKLMLGLKNGLAILSYNGTSFEIKGKVEDLNYNITSIVEEPNGFWLSTANNGVIKAPNTTDLKLLKGLKPLPANSGLPTTKEVKVFVVDELVLATTEKGLYSFKDTSFQPANLFGTDHAANQMVVEDIFADNTASIYLPDGESTIYMVSPESKGIARPTDKGYYVWDVRDLNRIPDQNLNKIYSDPNGTYIWFCGEESLIQFDKRLKRQPFTDFKTLITQVKLTTNDSILLGGPYPGADGSGSLVQSDYLKANLGYKDNALRFEFTSTNFESPEATRFQYMLEGSDKKWSDWTDETRKDYTNLSPGNYTFKVRTKNVYGVISSDAFYQFSILTPLHKTSIAYFVYAIAFIGIIWLVMFTRSKQLKRDKHKLEKQVEERTAELQDSLDKLKTTQEQLISQEKLASLGQLTAGIAHEIKNPLNFVNNFSELTVELVEEIKEDILNDNKLSSDEKLKEVLEILNDIEKNCRKITEHGKRADNIVKGMLMHSRKDGSEKQVVSVNDFMEENINLAYRGIRGKNSNVTVEIERQFDVDAGEISIIKQDISRVLLNIANNAFYAAHKRKALADNGFISKVVFSTKRENGNIIFKIRDNGVGIDKNDLKKIFEPFFTTKPTGEGTGLGLSISHDIVVKGHGGELTADSEINNFTEFIIVLPDNKKT